MSQTLTQSKPNQDFNNSNFLKDVNSRFFNRSVDDKAFSDKLLGLGNINSIRALVKKDDLNKSDLRDLLYLLVGVEVKLANLDDYDRYHLGKYFVWIRESVKLAEFLYDYIDDMKAYSFKKEKNRVEILDNLNTILNYQLHNIKFLVDIFVYLLRSTLSVGGVGFDTLSKSRFDYEYGQTIRQPSMQQSERKKFLGIF